MRDQLFDAPGVKLVGDAAADGSEAAAPLYALRHWQQCAPRLAWTQVQDKTKPRRDEKKTFRGIGLLSRGATAQRKKQHT